jgi:hypothetical protein
MEMGFLLRTDAVTNVQAAVPLELYFPSNGMTAVMTEPQALLVMDSDVRTVVVVGGGVLKTSGPCANLLVDAGSGSGSTPFPLPAIAVVNMATMCVVQLQIGNADSTFVGELYNDIVVDPWCCTGSTWLVAGTGFHSGDPSITLLRRVAMDTLLPEPFGPEGALYTTPIGAPTYSIYNDRPTASVSLTTLSNMVVVGAHVQEAGDVLQSFLWTTTPKTLQMLVPASTTSYNDRASGHLPLVADTASLVLVRVFALPDDGVVVVARGYMTDEALCAVQVLRYTAETTLDVGFAVGGVLVWYNTDVVGGTYAMDAALATSNLVPPGTVVVVGNSFFSGATDPMQYRVPGFPFGFLDVASPFEPIPFAIEVKGYVSGGGECVSAAALVRVLFSQMCGCASHWASSVAFTSPISLIVMGDSWFHLGCPAQSAFVFDLAIATIRQSTSGKRGGPGRPSRAAPKDATATVQLLNNTPASVPAILVNSCTGMVTVDTLCPPSTTLRVRGPLVIGCLGPCEVDSRAVKGMVRYDADTDTLLVYNGTEWRTVLTQSVPPS